MTTLTRREPDFSMVGTDTFRGTMGSTLLRTQLYAKNDGEHRVYRDGLQKTDSSISGNLLVSAKSMNHNIKDPMAGCTLRCEGSRAIPTMLADKQQLKLSRKFYITKDVDITIQTLRNTTKVTRYTNEKVGTAGTPTGMDKTLVSYKEGQ